ncbi:MAG: hypothetical protein WD396_09720 [Pseudohongiellaceae bacterium]
MSNKPTPGVPARKTARFWPQLRRFLIFQLKLYVDAFRDLALSLLSVPAFVLDVVLQSHGPGSYFERVLQLGRRSERMINLFEQHDPAAEPGVDRVIEEMESRWRKRRDDVDDQP